MDKLDRAALKRERTLEAARTLFRRDGVRATSMEAIAREAGIAKPTLYAQYPDKNAVFAAILEQMLTEVLAAADAAFARPGPVSERIGHVLAAQSVVISRVIGGSPHAAALRDEPRRAGFEFRERHYRIDVRIAEALSAAGVRDAAGLLRLLKAVANGISLEYADPQAMSDAIVLAARRLIDPELPDGAATR